MPNIDVNAAQSGDADAAQAAYDLVYAELKHRARRSLRGVEGVTR